MLKKKKKSTNTTKIVHQLANIFYFLLIVRYADAQSALTKVR